MRLKRKEIIGATLIVAVGFALVGYLAGIVLMGGIKGRELKNLEAENARLLDQLDLYREQLRILDTRLAELEALLNLTSALDGTGLAGLAPALMTAGRATGTDPVLLAAICAHESGWGTSRLAVSKNNLAGLGACDDNPGRALTFTTREDCVLYLARLIRGKGGAGEIGSWYASDPRWASKVGACVRVIEGAGA